MDSKLFKEINEQSKLLKDLCEHLNMKKEDIPQELLDEILTEMDYEGQAKARAGELDWISDLKGQEPAQTSYRGREGGPRELPKAPTESPRVGDFIKLGNNLVKISDVKDQFGNMFAYHTPGQKPVMVDHLKLDKEVGGKRIYVPTV